MKKSKLLLSFALAAIMTTSCFALAACADDDKDKPHTEHKDENGDGLCDIGGEPWEDEGGDIVTPPEEVDMTEGVYNCLMGTYDLLIKFYDEDTYYLQTETTGYRGKYEIKDGQITYARTQADGTTYNTADHGAEAKWITGNKIIYFYQEDGVTPIDHDMNAREPEAHNDSVVIEGQCYAYGTPQNVLAYDEENDQIMSFRGVYGSRTLSHTTLRNFDINDEKAIEQAKFMVKELPEDAADGAVESDYFLTLSQKGYQTNIPALSAMGIDEGKFTQDGDTYILTDTISASTATLTVTESGATVTSGDKSVELVVWEDVTPFAAEIVGDALGGKITARIRLNEDGTLTIYGSDKNYAGKYMASEDGTITVSDIDDDCPVAIDSISFAEVDGVVTVTAKLTVSTGVAAFPSATVDASGTVTGALFGLGARALLTASSAESVFGDMKADLTFYSDCTMTISIGGQTKVTSFWTLDINTKNISFRKTSSGTLKFTLGMPATVTWTGKFDASEATDSTYTFSFEATQIGSLVGAEAEKKHAVTATLENDTLQNPVMTLSFLADGTLTITTPGLDTPITAEWSLSMAGGMPSVTIENCNNGTIEVGWGENSTYEFKWTGKIATYPIDVSVTFSMPSAELANLM